MSRYVFLDRDGTLVHDRGYTHRLSDYRLLDGVAEGLSLLQSAGYRLAIVTNQSGIGRGLYTSEDFQDFQALLTRDLAARGVSIGAQYFCPHRPDEGCECRKPQPGLIRRACAELGASPGESWMVGDSETDMQLADRAGLRGGVLVLTGHGVRARGRLRAEVPAAEDLTAAARYILSAEES